MRSLAAGIERYILRKEQAPSTAAHIIAILLFISIVRLGLERLPAGEIDQSFLLADLLLRVIFYTGTFFLFFTFASKFFPEQTSKVRSVVLFGMFGSLFPPFFTALFNHGGTLRYDYFYQFTWDFFSPSQAVGESIGLWLTVAIVGIYFLYRKRSLWYTIAGLAGAYIILQFSAWFLIFPTILIDGFLLHTSANSGFLAAFSINLVWMLISLGCLFYLRRESFTATFKRIPHTFIRCILVLAGAQLAGTVSPLTFVDGIMFMIGFMLIQAENDYYDKEIDSIQSRASLMTQDDLVFVRFFMLLLVLNIYIIQPMVGVLMLLFFLLGFMYNHTLFRLKRNFLGSSLVEGLAALAGLLAGIFSVQKSISGTEILWISILSVIFAVASNIKDYKDIESDKKGGIKTLYVALDKHGVSSEKTHRVLLGLLFFIYVAILVYFGIKFHPPLVALAPGIILIVFSLLPFMLISQTKRAVSSVVAITVAALFLVYVCWYLLPFFVNL